MSALEFSRLPALLITDSNGNQSRAEVREFPFRIGRQSGNHLMLRDARASRNHAQLLVDGADFVIEDLNSRHGTWVNGARVTRQTLHNGDRVEFGVPDSYTLIFERPGAAAGEALNHVPTIQESTPTTAGGGNLTRLRAVLEVGRALQNAFSIDSVLDAVVDAALTVTGAERGFLLVKEGDGLNIRCGRDRKGPLKDADLRVPRTLIRKALDERRETFSMQFDPEAGKDPSSTVSVLELRSVVCIPLVRVQIGGKGEAGETLGLLYLDSRAEKRDLAANNREVLETLAVEASTALENARLIEEERERRHLDEELAVARSIQQSLLPRELPETGWLRAAGFTRPSHDVGGDYYDVIPLGAEYRLVVLADVAGKGLSSALVASILQGAFLTMNDNPDSIRRSIERMNRFFSERALGAKYATIFCAIIEQDGVIRGINAGHLPPIHVPLHGGVELIPATAPPVGLLEDARFEVDEGRLEPGDRLVLYSDGVTEAHNEGGEFYGSERLMELVRANADRPCTLLHDAILQDVNRFTGGAEQADDLTLLVIEYRPE
jgi:serine phosphatase RsbU (regulator of sigma subunit)